jgi:hypothetical protein
VYFTATKGAETAYSVSLAFSKQKRYYEAGMIVSFNDAETEKIFGGERSAELPENMQNTARRKLFMAVRCLVWVPSGWRFLNVT